MSVVFNIDNLRARQKELKAEIQKILDVSQPERETRDRFVQETDAIRRKMNEALKALEAPLAELRNEEALIAKALGGRSLSTSWE